MSKPIILNITKKQQARNAAAFADAARKGFIAGCISGSVSSIISGFIGAKIGEVLTENRISNLADLMDELDENIDELADEVDGLNEDMTVDSKPVKKGNGTGTKQD